MPANDKWNTALSQVSKNKILIRGYRIEDLMDTCSFGDMIYLTFTGELPRGNEGKMLESIVVSSTDHAFFAPSINATRYVSSGGVPLQAAVASGLIALGEHHGGAVEQCARMLQEAISNGREAADIVSGYRARSRRVPGFGHPLHDPDPRVARLLDQARRWKIGGPHLELAGRIAEELGKSMNVDGAISGIVADMGIDWRYGKAFFLISRSVGLAAHHVEEITRERPFRALPVENATYDGPDERDIPGTFRRRI
jgi:citrate synthase